MTPRGVGTVAAEGEKQRSVVEPERRSDQGHVTAGARPHELFAAAQKHSSVVAYLKSSHTDSSTG